MFSAWRVKTSQIPFHTRTDRGFKDDFSFQSVNLGAFWQKYCSSDHSPFWIPCSCEKKKKTKPLFCLTVQNSFPGCICCIALCLKIYVHKLDWQSPGYHAMIVEIIKVTALIHFQPKSTQPNFIIFILKPQLIVPRRKQIM